MPTSMYEPSYLTLSRQGFFAPTNQRRQTLRQVLVKVPCAVESLSSPIAPPPVRKDPNEPSGSGLTPPPTPLKLPPMSMSQQQTPGRQVAPNFPRSRVLVVGAESVYALLPSTLISQADGLLESGRLADAIYFVAQVQKKIIAKGLGPDNEFVSLRASHLISSHLRRLFNVGGRYSLHPPADRLNMPSRNHFRGSWG